MTSTPPEPVPLVGHQRGCPYVLWLIDPDPPTNAPPECTCSRHLPAATRIDWDSLPTVHIDRPVVIEGRGGRVAVIPEVGPPLAEVDCPGCGTTIRARMADAQHPAPIGAILVRFLGDGTREIHERGVFTTPEQAEAYRSTLYFHNPWRVLTLVPPT